MKKPITHPLPDSPLLGRFKMSNQQCLTNASLAGIRKGGWPLLCASPRRNLPGEREGNGGDGRGWRRARGGVGAVTHASLMGWTDWTCVIQMPTAEDKHQHTCCKTIPKRCTKIILGKSHSISQWRRKVQETKLGTSLETL